MQLTRFVILHQLDNIATVKKLVEFYVTEHNRKQACDHCSRLPREDVAA